jgi:4-hydroxyphenylacetate 3-monooxygenase
MTRTGSDYIRSIRDGRNVFLDGSKVEDVTVHPAYAEGVKAVARLYDIASDPANRGLMTYPSPGDAQPINTIWLIPRTPEDLVARRRAHKTWSDATYGLLGRSPDHVAAFLAGFAGAPDFFARGGQHFADNLLRVYDKASREDLYMAYTIVHPTVDRSKPASKQPEPNLYASVHKEADGGAIIRGAQMIGTGAVMADYIYVSVILPQRPGDEDYAIAFIVPCNAPGLKIYSRRPYSVGHPSVFDYPLSTRFDETDSLVVFDDVFIPWEHFFIYRDIELTYGQFVETAAHALGNFQAQVRFWSKLQFLVGLVKRIADRNGQSAAFDVQGRLGELAARATLVEGLIIAQESMAITDKNGVVWPNPQMLYANQTLQSSLYPEMVQTVRDMMGGSLIQLPSSSRDFADPHIAADLHRYVRWPSTDGYERVKLLKLLWDMIGSEFGGRHVQYEMFYAGPPAVVKTKEFATYNWADAERLVDQCLNSYDLTTEAASTVRRES